MLGFSWQKEVKSNVTVDGEEREVILLIDVPNSVQATRIRREFFKYRAADRVADEALKDWEKTCSEEDDPGDDTLYDRYMGLRIKSEELSAGVLEAMIPFIVDVYDSNQKPVRFEDEEWISLPNESKKKAVHHFSSMFFGPVVQAMNEGAEASELGK